MKILTLIGALLLAISAAAQTTTVTGTNISDSNGNPYANGTASAIQVVPTGQNAGNPLNVSTTSSGSFTMVLASPASYVFTICAAPVNIGPKANLTPQQVCFSSLPILISGVSQDVTGNLPTAPILGPGGSGGASAIVALKPSLPNDPIQFVSPNGNDGNDGLSWGSAKQTMYAALQALPGGSAGNVGAGTVMVSGSFNYGGPAASQGMWIMGSIDPNFASPPLGWLKKASTSALVNIVCAIPGFQFAHGHSPSCIMNGGGQADLVHPAIWLSGTANINFTNIGLSNFLNTYVKLGIDSNNLRTGLTGGDSSISFDGLAFNHGSCRFGGGPGIDIGSNTFWVWMRNLNVTGCSFGELTIAAPGTPGLSRSSNVVTVTTTATNSITAGATQWITITNAADPSFNGSFVVQSTPSGTQFTYNQIGPNATSGNGQVITAAKAAINQDSGGGTGSGLIFLENFQTNSGGIRIVPGTQGAGMYIKNGDYEGDGVNPDMPEVLVTSVVATANGTGMNVTVENVEVSDAIVFQPGVQVDNAGIPAVQVSRVDNGVKGQANVRGATPAYDNTVSPLRAGNVGFNFFGRVTGGGIDASRRGFGPVAVISPNLAATNPASWTFSTGAGTITSSIASPDGLTGAGRVTSNSGLSQVAFYTLLNTPITMGDTYIYGVWQRFNANGPFIAAPVFVLNNSGFGANDSCTSLGSASGYTLFPQLSGDGQWIWMSGICQVFSNPVNAGIMFGGNVTNPTVIDFYGPTLIKIPAGTRSNNDLYEIALNLAPFPPTAAAGEVSMFGNQLFRPGATTFANLGTPSNGVFIYCSDCTVANPCAGSGTGALAKRLNGAWVCN